MKDIIILQETLALVDRELKTLTEKVSSLESTIREMRDLQVDMKGLKIFLGRLHPEFKSQFPEIVKKIGD